MDIEKANRQSGNWVDGYCLKRCVPCGNPLCADEAMRANQISEHAPLNAKQAGEHSLKTVKSCFSGNPESFKCPLGRNQNEVEAVVVSLINREK
jgi:hypothetical protein